MTIALVAHDSKKELMVQFCTAYRHILAQHHLIATGTTGRLVEENVGLPVQKFLPGGHGGALRRRLAARRGWQDKPAVEKKLKAEQRRKAHCKANKARRQQVAPQKPCEGKPPYSLFHLYPTPHTVSMGERPKAFSFARIFFTCSATAESSAVPSKPNTAS